jgi:outer membrane protein assembly factor BamB
MKRTPALALVLGLFASTLFAADWPQWQGPTRDNISPEKGLLKQWPMKGPPLLWTFKDTGIGYSGPAVVGDHLYILGARDGTEYLLALDVTAGKELWKAKIGPSYTFPGNQWGDGPRATPSVAGGCVYALGGYGDLICVKADSGKEQWRVRMTKDLGGAIEAGEVGPPGIGCGYSWSPLVDGDQVICFPGGPKGAVAALDRNKGTVRWRSKGLTDQSSYSSPIAADVDGVRQYIVLFSNGLAGVDAKNGNVLWQYKVRRPYPAIAVIPTPLYHDGHVYVSVGEGMGCDLVKLTKNSETFDPKKVYSSNKTMKNELGGYVLVEGHVYGYSDKRGWVCQKFATAKEVWTQKGELGAGSVIYADGHLYCYEEDSGIVALVKASPKEEWKEKGRFEIPQHAKKALSGRHWTHPVIANGRLYLRDQEFLFCYKIK